MQDLDKFKNDVNASGKNVHVGNRYVPKIFGEWDNTKLYEPLSIVQYQGTSYTSRQYVPIGIEITNKEYWAVTGNYNAQVEQYRQDVESFNDKIIAINNDVKTILNDYSINVRNFKNDNNTWGQALQEAIDYGNTIYTAKQELGGYFVPQNVLIKMPRGRYLITEKIIGKQGLDFDFTGATFIANPSDKTIDFFDFTGVNGAGRLFRNHFNGGTFVGFNKVLPFTTLNTDTSNIVWENPTFQYCRVGIDMLSYNSTRSTYIKIENMYSLKTDQAVKTHADMCDIIGGWITHSGYDGAAIYNQGFTKIESVVLVPTPKLESHYKPRWIDNHSDDTTTFIGGERGLKISHVRAGGESGSMPLVFNYATHAKTSGNYKKTVLEIDFSQLYSVGTYKKAPIVLFDLPNFIKMSGFSGGTGLEDGFITIDESFNVDDIPITNYISIELDSSFKNVSQYPMVHPKLKRFIRRTDNINDMFRWTFPEAFTGQIPCVETVDNKPKASLTVRVPHASSPATVARKGFAFLLTVSAGLGSYAYKSVSTYIVHATGIHDGTAAKYELSYEPLKTTNGGYLKDLNIEIESLHWGNDDTGEPIINFPVVDSNETITVVLNKGSYSSAGISVIPIFGI